MIPVDRMLEVERRRAARYQRLRNLNPELYSRCVATASAIAFHHNLVLPAAAEIEDSLVALALDLTEGKQ